MRAQMIEALRQHAEANIKKHKMNVEIYLEKAVGVGEHSDIMETIEKEIGKIFLRANQIYRLKIPLSVRAFSAGFRSSL